MRAGEWRRGTLGRTSLGRTSHKGRRMVDPDLAVAGGEALAELQAVGHRDEGPQAGEMRESHSLIGAQTADAVDLHRRVPLQALCHVEEERCQLQGWHGVQRQPREVEHDASLPTARWRGQHRDGAAPGQRLETLEGHIAEVLGMLGLECVQAEGHAARLARIKLRAAQEAQQRRVAHIRLLLRRQLQQAEPQRVHSLEAQAGNLAELGLRRCPQLPRQGDAVERLRVAAGVIHESAGRGADVNERHVTRLTVPGARGLPQPSAPFPSAPLAPQVQPQAAGPLLLASRPSPSCASCRQ